MATGEKNNAWGTINNSNLELLEETGSGVATVTIGVNDYDLTITQGVASPGRNMVIVVISSVSLSTTATIKVPQNTPKVYAFHNMTTGNQSVLVKTSGGTGVEVAPEGKTWVYATSTSVVEIGFNNAFFNVWNGSGNGVIDNANNLRVALSAAAVNGKTLYVPPGTYLLASTVTIPASIGGIVMAPNATFLIDHASIGLNATEGTTRRNRQQYVIDVVKNVQSDWTSEDSVGFRAANFFESTLYVRRADKFTIGFQSLGDGTGNSYNDVQLGRLADNKIAVDIRTSGAASWNNENLYRGGRLAVTNGVNTSLDRTGIRFSAATTDSYQNHNQNIFLKPSFELDASISCQTYAVRDEVATRNNTILYARGEDCSKNLVYFVSGSQGNLFQLGYNGVSVSVEVTTGAAVDGTFGWYVEDAGNEDVRRSMREVYSLPSLKNHIIPYVSSVAIKGLNIRSLSSVSIGTSIGSHALLKSGNLTATANGALISTSRAVGVYVNTEEVKRFALNWDSGGNAQGRQAVWCYDANNNLIDTSATPVRATRGAWTYSSIGHFWSPSADVTPESTRNKTEFVVPEVAKRAFIGVRVGSTDVSLENFHLTTSQYRAPQILMPVRSDRSGLELIEKIETSTTVNFIPFEWPSLPNLEITVNNILTTGTASNSGLQFSTDGGNTYIGSSTYLASGLTQTNLSTATYSLFSNVFITGATNSLFNNNTTIIRVHQLNNNILGAFNSYSVGGGGGIVQNINGSAQYIAGSPVTHARFITVNVQDILPGASIIIKGLT